MPEPSSPAGKAIPAETSHVQRVACGVLAALLGLLGLWTLRGFLPALAWAVIFAIAVWPLYRRARAPWGGGPGRMPGVWPVWLPL